MDFTGKRYTVFTDEHSKPNHRGNWNSYGVFDNETDRKHPEYYDMASYKDAKDKAIELNNEIEG